MRTASRSRTPTAGCGREAPRKWGLGYLHLFIAAYIRMVSLRPGINRFVAGRRIYARNNIEVVLTVRRSMSTTSNETTIKAVFAPTDTIFDVAR